MQGNLGAVQGLNSRLKSVLLKEMDNKDTPENRKSLAEREKENLLPLIIIPREVEANVHEGFEPLTVSSDILDTYMIKFINVILDHDDKTTPDAVFVENLKSTLVWFIGEWIDELQDGFVNGMQDVIIFFRKNLEKVLTEMGGPEMGMMISMMGTETSMTFIINSYKTYEVEKEKRRRLREEQKL